MGCLISRRLTLGGEGKESWGGSATPVGWKVPLWSLGSPSYWPALLWTLGGLPVCQPRSSELPGPDILCQKSGVPGEANKVTSPFIQVPPSLAVSSNTDQSILWELLFMPDYTVIMAYPQTHQNHVVINCIWLHYEIQDIVSQSS